MSSRTKMAIAAAVLAPVLGGLFVLLRHEKAQRAAPPAKKLETPKGPGSTAHEMAALEVEMKKNPTHTPILLRMAELKRESGKTEEAIGLLRKASEADAGNIEAKLELGRALFESGDAQGAIAATQAILDKDPKHVDALYNLGAIYGNMGNEGSARVFFKRAVEAGAATESGKKARAALEVLDRAPQNPHAAAAVHSR